MEKLVYVVWKRDADDDAQFAWELLGPVADALATAGATGRSINLVDAHAASVQKARITKLSPPPSAIVGFWLDNADDRGPCEEALAGASSRIAGSTTSPSRKMACRSAASTRPTPIRPAGCIRGRLAPSTSLATTR